MLMSYPKLLKAPARRLLLTFVMTAGMTVAVNPAPARTSLGPTAGHRPAASAPRARQTIDYSKIQGIQRWGLNE